ncbi:MAG: magnesium transporter [Culicoidibacterales bacterium]
MNHAQKKRAMQLKRVQDYMERQEMEYFRDYFLDLHPFDQFVIFKEVDTKQQHYFYEWLSPDEVAEFFRYFEPEDRIKKYFDQMLPTYASAILGAMPSDDAADILQQLPKTQKEHYLKFLHRTDREDIVDALTHEQESAGGIMSYDMIVVEAHLNVREALELVIEKAPEADMIYVIYVVDEYDRLVGVLSLRELLVAPATQTVGEIMSYDVVSVTEETDQEEAAKLLQDYNLLALPVLDEHEHLKGIITFDDAMDVLTEEYEENLLNLQGIGAETAQSTIWYSIKNRYKWSFVFTCLSLIVAVVISRFETVILGLPLLVAFLPVISNVASASGNQTLAVILLALEREDELLTWSEVLALLGRQLLIALPITVAISIIVGGMASLFSQNWIFISLVASTILVATLLSNALAVVIPVVLTKFNRNPHVLAGTIVTISVDVLIFTSYFITAQFLISKSLIYL